MVIQRTAFIFSVDHSTDQVIALCASSPFCHHNFHYRVIQVLNRFTGKGTIDTRFLRIDLVGGHQRESPSSVLFEFIWVVAWKAHQRVHLTDGEIQPEIHQVGFLVCLHWQQKLFPNHPVDFRSPLVDRFRHEHWLQQGPCTTMLFTVHG